MGSSTNSEGEVAETRGDMKAIAGPKLFAKDRQIDRRSYSITPPSQRPMRSPLRYEDRSPSPYRHSHGDEKQRRRDNHRDNHRDDHRDDHRNNHRDFRDARGRSHRDARIPRTYHDLDQPSREDSYRSGHNYAVDRHSGRSDRDRKRGREPDRLSPGLDRERSRSPWRPGKENNSGKHKDSSTQNGTRPPPREERTSKSFEAPSFVRSGHHIEPKSKRVKFDATAIVPNAESEPQPTTEPIDEEAEIERRRRERQAKKEALLNKTKPSTLLTQALNPQMVPESVPATPPIDASRATSRHVTPTASAPSTPRGDSNPNSPMLTDDITKELEGLGEDMDEPSAALYDPKMDDEDRARHEANRDRQEAGEDVQKGVAMATDQSTEDEKQPAADMFADNSDDDDMFATEKPIRSSNANQAMEAPTRGMALAADLHDSWDTPDGFYKTILGELIDNRYVVKSGLGKGVFATVVRAQDIEAKCLVAIKIVRNNEAMRKAGLKEIDILGRLAQADPPDQFHIVRLQRYFTHKNHLCMVFENLGSNLRDLIKNYGRKTGLELQVVRSYAVQMFKALVLLRKCEILHADLKPDNILSDAAQGRKIKVADLGSATSASDTEITPYIASRYYRSPEVMLGIPPGYAIDMWAVGCTLFELYTDAILFMGKSNNDMLRVIQQCRGKISKKVIRRGADELKYAHFDAALEKFASVERVGIPPKDTVQWINFGSQPLAGRDLKTRLLKAANKKGTKSAEQLRELEDFRDLLDKCLKLDPEERITPRQALAHKFCSGRSASTVKSVGRR